MKKAITILAVLIVLVGAVFANETHTIKVKADVTEVVPVFALKLDTYKTNTAALVNREGNTTEYITQYGKGENYGDLTTNTAIDVGFNLDGAGTVSFTALLLNKAKQNETYTLTFGGGVFNVTRGVTPGTYGPDSITTTKGENTAGLSITYGAAAADGNPAQITEQNPATNKVIELEFNGTTVNAVTANGYTLATAVYSYPGDPQINPTAQDEYYYADVTLLIAAT